MDSWLLAAALTSALLHASWHAVVKSSAQPAHAMTAQMAGSALLSVPVLLWTGLPALAAWPWMIGSTVLSICSVSALLRGYAQGGFGTVYPITRAASVLLVLPLAAAVAGEWPTTTALIGVGLVSVAVMLLALRHGTDKAGGISRPALGWVLIAAAFTAAYVVCDAQGVRRAQSPLAYGFTNSVANGALWAWLQHRGGMHLRTVAAAEWRRAVLTAFAAMASYLLILWVYTRAPIALGSALRDTSAIFATLIALIVLKEPFHRTVVFAVALATAGAVLIRLG